MDQPTENPYETPGVDEAANANEPTEYRDVPLLRRNGFCSLLIVSHLIVTFLSGCVPVARYVSILTMIGVIVVCITVLTGPIYYNKSALGRPMGAGQKSTGRLQRWSGLNKVAAVILLILFLAINAFVIYAAINQNVELR